MEAKNLCADLVENLSIAGLKSLRIINRYNIEDIGDDVFAETLDTIISEPPVDNIYEQMSFADDETVFAVSYLPGQYDQRADSLAQCVQIISGGNMPVVSVAKLYVLKGCISQQDAEKIKKYCINTVDSHEVSLEIPKTLRLELEEPKDIDTVNGFIEFSDAEIAKMRSDFGLAMSQNDLLFCQKYFKDIQREPTITEIRLIDTYWSDHCRHTTFLTEINSVVIDDGFLKHTLEQSYSNYMEERKILNIKKDICLMDIAVMGMKALRAKGKLQDLDISDEINACSIKIDVDNDGAIEEWLLMFKNETHNHPTEIEPFGGAATCLGGAIRDPLSGRSYVYQAMRVTGCGNPLTKISDTIEGKLPQSKITKEAARGYSSYGNQIGLSTGYVKEIYDEGYTAKRMEIGAVLGATPASNVKREVPVAGDIVILVGGRTGRDGIGGATGSSKEHDNKSLASCGAEVQKGNPPTERKLQRLFRKKELAALIKRCNDFGAGGVAVAIGELADGLAVNLDAVPKKYTGLNGTEIAISESQERMAVVVDKSDTDKFMQIAAQENLEATIVAEVTEEKSLKMYWRGNKIVEISREFLNSNGAKQYADVHVEMPSEQNPFECKKISDIKSKWINNISDLNCASQKGLVEMFDSTIGAGTVLMPYGGKHRLTEIQCMVSKLPTTGETKTVSAMSYGYNPSIFKWSPFHGGMFSVLESISKIVCSGCDYTKIRLTFQEYFERMNDAKKWGKAFSALLGALQAQLDTELPAIGGKDSMSGTFNDLNVPPTLVSFAVSHCNIDCIISPELKNTDNKIFVVPAVYNEHFIPEFKKILENYSLVHKLIINKDIKSAYAVTNGGIAEAVSKMAFGSNIGITFEQNIDCENLFIPSIGTLVLELDKEYDTTQLEKIGYLLGYTTEKKSFTINNTEIMLEEMIQSWEKPLEKIFKTKTTENSLPVELTLHQSKNITFSSSRFAMPTVFIPVFPGTNCEFDSIRQFEMYGAHVEPFVFKNITAQMLNDSINEMVKLISKSQIVMIPGGFSAGDEPEGSGKFIACVFRNPYIKDEISKLINKRDGLMLGICNGFQALLKLGLLPDGEIKKLSSASPTLTYNSIGRHISCFAETKIISNKSPWLNLVNAGDIHTIPVSHGEGRFVASQEVFDKLNANGQIATQFVNNFGQPSMDIKYNPNGSMYGVEGILSIDGRIFGKMGHSERIGYGLYKNINGNFDQKIFESGVNYFKI